MHNIRKDDHPAGHHSSMASQWLFKRMIWPLSAHPWGQWEASGRANSVEICRFTVLATALWAPSILCVAGGALQWHWVAASASGHPQHPLYISLDSAFEQHLWSLWGVFVSRVLHASVAMVAVLQPNFCLLPHYLGKMLGFSHVEPEPKRVVYDRPDGPSSPSSSVCKNGPRTDHDGASGRQGSLKKDTSSTHWNQESSPRSWQTFLVKRILFVNHAKKTKTFFAVNVPLTF